MTTILLVCTGNICRTPMAEGLLASHLHRRGVADVAVASAGVSGWGGESATREAVEALKELDVDISTHVARHLKRAMVEAADVVIGMAGEHREAIVRLAPNAADRTFTLKELVHLLDGRRPIPGADRAAQLRVAVEEAQARRTASAPEGLADEDVADPLGLGLESFRAAAWELEELSGRLATELFGPAPGDEAAASASAGASGVPSAWKATFGEPEGRS